MTRSQLTGCLALGLTLSGLLSGPASAMTEEELRQLYLDVVELTVDVFEPIWVDDSKNVPNAGYYDFRKYDTWGPKWYANVVTVPGCGQIAYCYSVLLSETDKATFGKTKLSRADMLDRCIKAIRWCCMTSAYVKNPYPFHPVVVPHNFYDGKQWRRKLGYRADELGWFTVACARLWDKLDNETKGLVEQVMIGGAQPERLVRTWRLGGGGNHDVVKQDLSSTTGAAYLFPNRDDHKKYQDIIRGNGVDLVATVHDLACNIKADGKTIREWSKDAWNLYQDYSSDHHGWCQVWYGCDLVFEGRLYIELLSHLYNLPVPEVYTYEGNGFDGVLDWVKTICLPEGEPASVHGMEYDAYYGSGLLAYCYGATIKKDSVSAALEEQAAQLLKRHTQAVRLYDYHRNCYAKAATCYLLHKIHGPRANPLSPAEAWRARNGNTHYRWQQCLVHRSDKKWASWSWGTISAGGGRMAGLVAPARNGGGTDEPLMYLLQNSLIGTKSVKWTGDKPKGFRSDVVYRHRCSDDGLSTAGTVVEPGIDRHYAFFAFDDGPCVLFTVFRARQACQMYFQGIPIFFYVRPKLTSSRLYWDAQGTQPLETTAIRSSPWWCVADRLGMATVGGSKKLRIKRVTGKNWARTSAYKDKADAIYTGTIDEVKVPAGGLGVDMATAIYTETPHEAVAKASQALEKGVLELPHRWKGVVMPDAHCPGRRHLAVVNFDGGECEANLSLSFDEGAPILSTETVITGKRGSAKLHLEQLGSAGLTLDLYAEVPDSKTVRARRVSRVRFVLIPEGSPNATVDVRYPPAAGRAYDLNVQNAKIAGRDTGSNTVTLALSGPACVDIVPRLEADGLGPAVEITDLRHREDGRVEIEVTAEDQSGIAFVELYRDGKPLPMPPAGKYVWVDHPGSGAHTYRAVAADASTQKNTRISFKRTVIVERGKTRP